jgi:hypothetical protein
MMPTIDLQALIDWHKSDLHGKSRADLKAIRDDFREKAEDLLSEFEECRGLLPQEAIEHIEAEHDARIRGFGRSSPRAQRARHEILLSPAPKRSSRAEREGIAVRSITGLATLQPANCSTRSTG